MTNLPTFTVQAAPQGDSNIVVKWFTDEQDRGFLVLPARQAYVLLNFLLSASERFYWLTKAAWGNGHRFARVDYINGFNSHRLAEMYIRAGIGGANGTK
jgi:hypothetical protein